MALRLSPSRTWAKSLTGSVSCGGAGCASAMLTTGTKNELATQETKNTTLTMGARRGAAHRARAQSPRSEGREDFVSSFVAQNVFVFFVRVFTGGRATCLSRAQVVRRQ